MLTELNVLQQMIKLITPHIGVPNSSAGTYFEGAVIDQKVLLDLNSNFSARIKTPKTLEALLFLYFSYHHY